MQLTQQLYTVVSDSYVPGRAQHPESLCAESLGGELLQILSQQDQAVDDEDAEEPMATVATHVVGEADGAPTDGKDEELQDALAAETEHKVGSWP